MACAVPVCEAVYDAALMGAAVAHRLNACQLVMPVLKRLVAPTVSAEQKEGQQRAEGNYLQKHPHRHRGAVMLDEVP